jgi:hypothetical protein
MPLARAAIAVRIVIALVAAWHWPAHSAPALKLLNRQQLDKWTEVTIKIPWEPGYDMVENFLVDCKTGRVTNETMAERLPFSPALIARIRLLACEQ